MSNTENDKEIFLILQLTKPVKSIKLKVFEKDFTQGNFVDLEFENEQNVIPIRVNTKKNIYMEITELNGKKYNGKMTKYENIEKIDESDICVVNNKMILEKVEFV